MKLGRFAMLTFERLSEDRRGWHFAIGPVSIETRGARVDTRGVHVLALASMTLSRLPSTTKTRLIKIPEGPRRRCNFALESAANLVSVSESVRRGISSPTPCLCLYAESPFETTWL